MALAHELVEAGVRTGEVDDAITDTVTLPCLHALDELPILIIDTVIAWHQLDTWHVDLSTAAKNLIAACTENEVDCISDCR